MVQRDVKYTYIVQCMEPRPRGTGPRRSAGASGQGGNQKFISGSFFFFPLLSFLFLYIPLAFLPADFRSIFVGSASAVTHTEKVQLTLMEVHYVLSNEPKINIVRYP